MEQEIKSPKHKKEALRDPSRASSSPLSMHMSVYLSLYLYVFMSGCLYIWMSLFCMSLCLCLSFNAVLILMGMGGLVLSFVFLPECLSLCLYYNAYVSFYISFYLSVCLFVVVYLYVFVYVYVFMSLSIWSIYLSFWMSSNVLKWPFYRFWGNFTFDKRGNIGEIGLFWGLWLGVRVFSDFSHFWGFWAFFGVFGPFLGGLINGEI